MWNFFSDCKEDFFPSKISVLQEQISLVDWMSCKFTCDDRQATDEMLKRDFTFFYLIIIINQLFNVVLVVLK